MVIYDQTEEAKKLLEKYNIFLIFFQSYFSQIYEYENLNNPKFYYFCAKLLDEKYFQDCFKNPPKQNSNFMKCYVDFLLSTNQVR